MHADKIEYSRYENEVWDEEEVKRLFQKLLLYNVLIEKPTIKHLEDIDLLHEFPFYDALRIVKRSQEFRRYERSYEIDIIDSKDPLAQLEASKSRIKNMFKDLLDEIKGFKYQITVKVLLRKHEENGGMWFVPICSSIHAC